MNEPVNILYLITELNVGGAERSLYQLVKRINRDRYRPLVSCLYGKGILGRKMEKEGFPVFYLNMRNRLDFTALFRLCKLLRRERVKILHSFLFHANFIGRIGARLAGVPVVISSVRVTEMEKGWHLLLDRMTIGLVDVETCVCEAVKEFTVRRGKIPPPKLVTIYNGVEIEEFKRFPPIERKKKERGLSGFHPLIGTVSRLTLQKGLPYLLRAFKEVVSRFPRALLVVVGEGPLRRELENMARELGIEEKVRFLGFREDVREILLLLDLFVLSSLWEGLPNVLLEAMALRRAVIATEVGGNREIIENGKSGLLVPPQNARNLAHAMLNLLENKELARRMGEEAYRRVENSFSLQQMVLKTQRLYEDLIKKKRVDV